MNVTDATTMARRLNLRGQVQGVGLRPTAARVASELELAGYVCNTSSGVEIYIEGAPDHVDAFERRLQECIPNEAHIVEIVSNLCEPISAEAFLIADSLLRGPLRTRIPCDISTCDECLHDVADPDNRRTGYPFTSCTSCGPRYSLINEMPYDRSRTSMDDFPLCAQCRAEYVSPDDRRFHAQTTACEICGPHLWISPPSSSGVPPLEEAARAICSGQVVAIRGLGGYQLVVDATSEQAVQRLRNRKKRPAKPLAVMVQTLADAERIAELTEASRLSLSSSERPIVLVPAQMPNSLTAGIHPGLTEVGLFLPTTALHWLLLEHAGRPLVVTSGNVEGEPLAISPEEAERDLHGIADLWLHHNLEIIRPVDDSVVRVINHRPVTIRNARGFAPLPLESLEAAFQNNSPNLPTVLAVGGHLKNAIALFNGAQAVLGPHLGDLDSLASRQRFQAHVQQFQSLCGFQPTVIVHDAHPDYFTTRWAESTGQETIAVQHHHAHVVAAMVENNWLDREVLGVAFDGTGFGSDGTIWGGEFLRTTMNGYERVACVRPFPLPGGEVAIREPWRVAAALLVDAVGVKAAAHLIEQMKWNDGYSKDVLRIADNARLSPSTSSAGRLFDGVASLILGLRTSEFEGHAAMLLESAADRSHVVKNGCHWSACPPVQTTLTRQLQADDQNCKADDSTRIEMYRFDVLAGQPCQLDWRPAIRELIADKQAECSPGVMAARFHRGLACGIAEICKINNLPVVLTGGVFQNCLLAELVLETLREFDFPVGLHSHIPPNDGGLAAGQLAIGMARLASRNPDEPTSSRRAV